VAGAEVGAETAGMAGVEARVGGGARNDCFVG
jgi:hypothetical protein